MAGHALNLVVFLALYLTPRGYAGCGVLATSAWLLGREDQIGYAVFRPTDHLERR